MKIKFPEIHWNWKKINLNQFSFPSSFKWGTATAAHQIEGNCINNWSEFENQINSSGIPNIKDGQKSGIACDSWNRLEEDIENIKKLGVSYYRFSIEWSKIEPEQNKYDTKVLNHYNEFINILIDNNITPVLTLYHFTHPIWFDKLRGFEKEENIKYFISFCIKVFNKYSNKVKYWCTINEPAVLAAQGYFNGIFPPGIKKPQLSAEVLKNLLETHVRVFHTLKHLDNGNKVKIGLVKNINQFDPWNRWNILDWIISYYVNSFFNNSSIIFFKTGIFSVNIPGLLSIYHKNKQAINSNDFIGLNYYSHNHVKFKLSIKEPFIIKYKSNEIMTDMPYTIYGEGLYRAIKSISKLNLPIIITENGIADKKDDKRELYINRYLYAVYKSIKEGYNVTGYFYWSLMDNFEWAFGYDMKFGLYSVDFKTLKRSLRQGSNAFIKLVKNKSE